MAKDVKVLKLKNYFLIGNEQLKIESLQNWLAKQMLHGKVSRARTRFLKLISDRVQEIDKERKEILEENSEKKKVKEEVTAKDGKKEKKEVEKIVYLDKEGKETTEKEKGVQFKIKDVKKLNKELEDYMNEDYVIDVTPANRDVIYGVRDLILNTEEEFSGIMASRYDEICEVVEAIK